MNKEEVDSLTALGQNNISRQYDEAMKNLNAISVALEYSIARMTSNDATLISLRDGKSYNKFDYSGFGVIFYRNDSTYVHRGMPTKEVFFEKATEFFPFSINSF